MGIRLWVGVTTILVIVSGALGYALPHKNMSPHSSATLLKEEVISDVRKQQLQQNNIPTQIRIINLGNNTESDGYAFVSFDVDGHQQYASLEVSPNGYSMSTFAIGTDKAVPIQYVTLQGNGIEYITGGVFNHPNVKSAVLMFSNGSTVCVPVEEGYFWYVHNIKSPTRNFVKQVVAVTDTGALLQNKPSSAKQ